MKVAMCGTWHVHAYDYIKYALRDAEVIGAFDEDPEKLAAFCKVFPVKALNSFEELLNSEAEGVIVCSSTNRHAEDMVKIAESGKGIFTEKVLALSTEECLRIEKAVHDSGVPFVISLVQKFTPGQRTVKQIADSGILGDLNYFRYRNCHDGSTGRWLPSHFFSGKECGGGAMIDLGAHGMYLLDWFMGLPENAKSTFTVFDRNELNQDHLEDNAVTVFGYEDGRIGISETGFVSTGCPQRLEVGGTRGYAVYENGKVFLSTGNEMKEVPAVEELPSPIEQFLSGKILPGCGMEEAKRLTRLMEMAYGNR